MKSRILTHMIALAQFISLAGPIRLGAQGQEHKPTHYTGIVSPAQTFKTLVSFDGTDGASPYFMSLVQGFDGNFYGNALLGGANQNNGTGTVFKITAAGKLTTLYSFCVRTDCADGQRPFAGLVQATNGNFYGTTEGGGNGGCKHSGCGTVFKITSGGELTTLDSFCAQTNSLPAQILSQGWCKPPTGTSAGQPPSAGPIASATPGTVLARSSQSPPGAHGPRFT